MLLYRDTLHGSRRDPPPWLVGVADVHCREGARGRLWGAGDGRVVGEQQHWLDLDDGWQCSAVGKAEPETCRREIAWADCGKVLSLAGEVWSAPILLTSDGNRAFRVAYGDDWLPALTPEQERAEAVANAAREALLRAVPSEDNPGEGLPMRVACQWAAELLSLAQGVTPQIIARLRVMDDRLAVGALMVATGMKVQHG